MSMPHEILNLLVKNEHAPLVQQLLREIQNNQGFEATGPIPLREVRDIYRQRARHIERTGYPVHGFPQLVKGLEAFTGDTITIFTVHFDSGDYSVFADAALSELAGVLKFPNVVAAQEFALVDPQQQEALRDTSHLQTV